MDLDAELFEDAKILIENGLWQSILGDGATHHAARAGMLFEYLDGNSAAGEFCSGRDPAGSGPDDRDFLAGRICHHPVVGA